MKYVVQFKVAGKQWFYQKPLSTTESAFTNSRRDAMQFDDMVSAGRLAQRLRMKHLQLRERKVAVRPFATKEGTLHARKNPSRGALAEAAKTLRYENKSLRREMRDRENSGHFSSSPRSNAELKASRYAKPSRAEIETEAKRIERREKLHAKRNPSARAKGLAEEAAHRFEAFTGHKAGKEYYFQERRSNVALEVGKLSGVMYEATRDGETAQYFHKFKKSSRPLLIADHDGSSLGIVGGRYRFTDRGIVDE